MVTARKALPFLIVLALSAPLLSAYQLFMVSDSMDMLSLAVSIYELGDLSSAVQVNAATGQSVSLYSKYGLGLPLAAVPFLLLFDIVSAAIEVRPEYVLGLVNVLALALSASVVSAAAVELGYGRQRALFVSIASVFGTFAFVYINNFLSEPLQGLFISAAFLFCLKAGRSRLHSLLAGAALGAAVLTKATNLALVPVFAAYLAWRFWKEGRLAAGMALFAFPLAAFGAAMAALNMARFGSALDFGYGQEAAMFVNPVLAGARDLLVNPSKGLLIYAPLALLLPYCLWKLRRKGKGAEALLAAALFIANYLIYSAWWAWEGADTWGPRFLLPLLPVAFAALAAALDSVPAKALAAVLFVAGFAVNVSAVLVDSSGYNYMVLRSTGSLEMEIARPKRDFLEAGGRLQPPPYVVTSVLPEFNVLSGNAWLLKARLYGPQLLSTPPWLGSHPGLRPPPVEALPEEIRIRLDCPPSALLSALACSGRRASAPYYYDAYTQQADKAEALGLTEAAARMRAKAQRALAEKQLRQRQMGY